MKEELTPLGHAKDSLIDLAIRFGPKLLTAILILTAGAFVATWVARAASRGLSRIDLEPPVRQLLTWDCSC
jgi:small conductance mechanosensitive channel